MIKYLNDWIDPIIKILASFVNMHSYNITTNVITYKEKLPNKIFKCK